MWTELIPLSSLLLFTYTPLQADRFAKVTNFFDNALVEYSLHVT